MNVIWRFLRQTFFTWKFKKKIYINLIQFLSFFTESKKSDHDNKSLGGTGNYLSIIKISKRTTAEYQLKKKIKIFFDLFNFTTNFFDWL